MQNGKLDSTHDSHLESSVQEDRPQRNDQKSNGRGKIPDHVRAALAPFVPKAEQNEEGMSKFFIPGWKGESLTSKRVKKFNDLLDVFPPRGH